MERLVMIVPDGQTKAPAGLIPGLHEPLLIERRKWACMLRAWRNDPAIPRDRRNFPTIGEVIGERVRSAILEQFTPAAP